MLKLRLSIITVCYNDKQGLELTLENISSQTCHNFEYIVIDGASSDGSTDLLVQYSDIIDYSVSEKDTGIYNAMNKGICYAHGEYCLFMNAGDTLYAKDTIQRVLPYLHNADFISGHTLCTFIDGKNTTWKSVNHVTTQLMMMYSLSHQATFIRTGLLKKRPYREDLRIVSDWEQMLYELIIKNGNYKKLDLYICKFAQGGISSKMFALRERERKKILDEYFPEKVQTDIVQPNLLVRITSLADEGSFYYKVLEFSARIIRFFFKK